MIVNRTYKYRIYPTKQQVTRLENQFSMCRHLYNWALSERISVYETTGKGVSYTEQQNNLLKRIKDERPWYRSVQSQVLQDVLHRLDEAYQHFFRRVKNGETPGFPKFKKRGQWDSITYPQQRKRPEYKKGAGFVIQVSKIGNVKINLHREIPWFAEIKTLQIKKEGDKWFACFCVKEDMSPQPKQDLPPLGIDLGLIDLYYTSNGDHCGAPKHYRKRQKHLARLQRRLAKTPKRSRKWYKLQKAVQKAHYRIRCQRLDFLHKQANSLLGQSDLIVHEDLKITNMIKRPKPKQDEDGQYIKNGACWKSGLNKSMADAGWGTFLNILHYKAKWWGKTVIKVPPHYTSQTCPECGVVVKKTLSTRTHACECGYKANRDHAAARNILRIGLDTLAATAA
jgi:putative transposase